MANPCSNDPNEVIAKIVSAKANADKFDRFVNGTDTQAVQLGTGAPTPTIRNVVRQIMADASWAKQFIADAPEGDVSLNNVTALNSSESRLLAERFADIVNVKDYGAKGDGSTDDTASLQAALDAAFAGSKACFLPSGTYLCSEKISVDMQSGGNLNIFSDNAVVKLDCEDPIPVFVEIIPRYSSNEVSIRDLTFDGDMNANIGLSIAHTESTKPSVNLEDVAVQNVKKTALENESDGIYINGEFENVRIINPVIKNIVMAEDTGDSGVTGVFGISVIRQNSTGYASDNTYIENPYIENVYCEDSTYTSDQDGIRCFSVYGLSGEVSADTFSVVGGFFKGIRGRAIKGQTQNCFVDGCTVVYGNDPAEFTGKIGEIISVDMQVGCGNVSNITFICDGVIPGVFVGMALKNNEDAVNAQGNINNIRAIIYGVSDVHPTAVVRCTNRLQVAGNEKTLNISNITVDSNVSFEYAATLYSAYSSEGSSNQHTNINIVNASLPISEAFMKVYNAGYAGVNIVNAKNIASSTAPLYEVQSKKHVVNGVNCFGFSGAPNIVNYSDCQVLCRNGNSYDGFAYAPSANDVFVASCAGASVAIVRILGGSEKNAVLYLGAQDYPQKAGIGSSGTTTGSLYFSVNGNTKAYITETAFTPSANNTFDLGRSSYAFANLYAGSGPWSSSDARLKDNVDSLSESLFRAWGKVSFKIFQMKDAIEKKGTGARIHVGVIAQEVAEAFASEGLDAGRYGLFGYDEWPDEYEETVVVDAEAVLDEEGNETTPALTHVERKKMQSAGNKYSIRYEEALALECAYQRWLGEKRDARIAELEAILNEISGNGPAPSGASPDNI